LLRTALRNFVRQPVELAEQLFNRATRPVDRLERRRFRFAT